MLSLFLTLQFFIVLSKINTCRHYFASFLVIFIFIKTINRITRTHQTITFDYFEHQPIVTFVHCSRTHVHTSWTIEYNCIDIQTHSPRSARHGLRRWPFTAGVRHALCGTVFSPAMESPEREDSNAHKKFFKRSHVRSRSGQRSEICVFGLLRMIAHRDWAINSRAPKLSQNASLQQESSLEEYYA